jgi:hypothetical protein
MIKEPLETDLKNIDPNKLNILSPPKTEFESKLSLLYVLLNSREGELIYKKDFGINWTSILPENMTDDQLKSFEYQVVEILNGKLKTYLPEFRVKNVEAYIAENVAKSEAGIVVMLTFIYNNKFVTDSITLIKWNDQFGTLFGNVRKWSPQDNESSDGISNRVIMNLIDTISEQLKQAH